MRCGASPGVLRFRVSCRLLPAWPHARLRFHPAPHRKALHRTAKHCTAPHHPGLLTGKRVEASMGCLVGRAFWPALSASQSVLSSPRASAASCLAFPSCLPPWFKPTAEPQRPQRTSSGVMWVLFQGRCRAGVWILAGAVGFGLVWGAGSRPLDRCPGVCKSGQAAGLNWEGLREPWLG